MWMVRDGMVLDPVRHRYALDQLNRRYFPFTYRDLERLAAFQNRVLAAYARAHGLPFVDVAATMPFDPNLFFDAVHKTYPGERLQGWVTFLLLRAADRAAAGERCLAQTGADDGADPSRLSGAAAARSGRLPEAWLR